MKIIKSRKISIHEVWGKVIFSQASVILSTGGGGGWLPNKHHRSHDQEGLPNTPGSNPPCM